jgi:hypothetical protein
MTRPTVCRVAGLLEAWFGATALHSHKQAYLSLVRC